MPLRVLAGMALLHLAAAGEVHFHLHFAPQQPGAHLADGWSIPAMRCSAHCVQIANAVQRQTCFSACRSGARVAVTVPHFAAEEAKEAKKVVVEENIAELENFTEESEDGEPLMTAGRCLELCDQLEKGKQADCYLACETALEA